MRSMHGHSKTCKKARMAGVRSIRRREEEHEAAEEGRDQIAPRSIGQVKSFVFFFPLWAESPKGLKSRSGTI